MHSVHGAEATADRTPATRCGLSRHSGDARRHGTAASGHLRAAARTQRTPFMGDASARSSDIRELGRTLSRQDAGKTRRRGVWQKGGLNDEQRTTNRERRQTHGWFSDRTCGARSPEPFQGCANASAENTGVDRRQRPSQAVLPHAAANSCGPFGVTHQAISKVITAARSAALLRETRHCREAADPRLQFRNQPC